ncbi:MAG: leucine-rich repeat domain-containing protein [Verrucomicrobia bacterium]|nr:leucine-rich repeat domain-containing protein [Verrucomicrobiota bacterium]
MSISNIINFVPKELWTCIFGLAVEDKEQPPSQTTQNIALTCKHWKDITFDTLLPSYWNCAKSVLYTYFSRTNAHQKINEIVTQLGVDQTALDLLKLLSKELGANSLMVLPCQYEHHILDTELEKMWDTISSEINFGQGCQPCSASEIRTWLKEPSNTPLVQGVTALNLSELNLQLLPPEIGSFTNLQTLYLRNNQLVSLPQEFGNLTNLELLSLQNNPLASLPKEFGNLTNLKELYLNDNQLTSLPHEFGNLPNLKELYLNDNQLTSLPHEFGNLPNLKYLSLDNNQLASRPQVLGNLTNLQKLSLEGNPCYTAPH